ncbi:hypothetical protein PQR33_22780 [Paraburkholderia sediminicola]|uniref:hypothetical protein n=1 Tax=Paraburkholderia sediminicola TaxID=458836 RepID=UPI0038B95F10
MPSPEVTIEQNLRVELVNSVGASWNFGPDRRTSARKFPGHCPLSRTRDQVGISDRNLMSEFFVAESRSTIAGALVVRAD